MPIPRGRRHFVFLLLAVIVAVLAGVWFFLAYGERRSAETKPAKLSAARKALISESQNQTLEKFSLTGFDDKGKSFWKLEGDQAKIEPSQTVFLDQNVTLRLQEDTVIKTDHVRWAQSGGLLRTDSYVRVNHQGIQITGVGAVGRLNDKFIQLNHNIEMLINRATRLTCDGPMKIYYNENKAIFYRKVKVVDERGTLHANRMDVIFDSQTRKIKSVQAIGNVIMVRGGDTTRSQRATYLVDTATVRLEGNPEVTVQKDGAKLLKGSFPGHTS